METTKTIFDYYKYDPNNSSDMIVKYEPNNSSDMIVKYDPNNSSDTIVKYTPPTVSTDIQIRTNLSDLSNLSEKQRLAYDKFVDGENLFITGPGGTGKTKIIKHFVDYADEMSEEIQVCAMTGCAAILLNCNARTIHSWSGIKLAKGTKNNVVKNVINNKYVMRTWKRVKILIIDEVSMLSQKIFEIIEEIARHAKKSQKPFGGMQVIFSGDFCQLPPVGNHGEPDTSRFCFESPLWNTLFPMTNCIEFTHIFRQTDPIYTKILHGIRKGVITKSSNEVLLKCVNKTFLPENHNGCIPTKLFPIRSKVDFINKLMFEKLTTENYSFELLKKDDNINFIDSGKLIPIAILKKCNSLTKLEIQYEFNQLITNSPAAQILHLKIGASVMCNINFDMDNGICNGAQGIIIDIDELKSVMIPVVKFSNGVIRHMFPHHWQSEEYPTVSISQYPLVLAWALTIHKIQGATLDLAEIDIGNSIFEYGQTYVALSRVKSLDGLYLSAFEPNKIQTNPSVIAFYKSIRENNVSTTICKSANLEKQYNRDIKRIVL
jgi:ATP-dependent DNA helicase PIF1